MGLRKVLLIIGGATFACMLICVAVFLIGLRAARNSVHDDVANAISSAVAVQVDSAPRVSGPMTIEVTEEDIARQIVQQYNDDGLEMGDVVVEFVAPNQMTVGLSPDDRNITYTATLGVDDGELDVIDIDGNIRAVTFLLPGGRVGDAIEDGVNDALFSQNLILESIDITNNQMTLIVTNGPTGS
ncbi:hypothetical protein BH09CHL1_BH09CHL1_22400 [soil metagenome]